MTAKTQNIIEKKATIKWFVSEEKIVRFEDGDTIYDTSDAVAALTGYDKGVTVSVKIDTSLGENGTIVFMEKASNDKPKQEVKQEAVKTTETSSGNKTVLTVGGLSFKTNGIIFVEQEKVWYTIPNDIGINNLKGYGIEKGTKVEVIIGEPEKAGHNKVITFIKKVADNEPAKPEVVENKVEPENKQSATKTNYSKANYSNDVQSSIEAQAAVNSACGLVGSMIQGQSVETLLTKLDDIKKLRRALAEDNFKLIQELKKV